MRATDTDLQRSACALAITGHNALMTTKQANRAAERKLNAASEKCREAHRLILDAGDVLIAAGFQREHLTAALVALTKAEIVLKDA